MKQLSILILVILLIACNQKNIDKNTFKIGVASQNINPKMGAFIAGDKINRQFTSIHDSLYVKAMVIDDSKTAMALIVFDCIGMLHPTLEDIRKEVSTRIPMNELDPSHIVMASTHTHCGPDVVGIWGPDQMTSGVDQDYMKSIVQKSSEAIVTAWQNKNSATAVYAKGEFGNDWVYNISDSLNLDRSLTMLQFKDNEGASIATLNNFACHPTIMDGVSNAVSADYVSAMYSHLDTHLGGVNFFLQGAIGGWVQPEYEKKSFESVEKRGRELGEEVIASLKEAKPLKIDSIQYKRKQIKLPVSNINFQQLTQLGVINRSMTDSVDTEIAWFSLGSAQFITHPGETTPTHALQSKKMMGNQGPKFVIGLGMDALGYILTPNFYVEQPKVKYTKYLTGMSIDKNAGVIMMNEINDLIPQE